MSPPKTLRDVSGFGNEAPSLKGSALVMIDLQNTYREGVMTLEGSSRRSGRRRRC